MRTYSLTVPIIFLAILVTVGTVIINSKKKDINKMNKESNENYQKATFAGGCFWCIEPAYQEMGGVINAVNGYTGGIKSTADYKQVSTGKTKHREAVQVTYNPELITYEELLEIFWRQIDPTDEGGQFTDRGHQYTTAIYYHDDNQKSLAEKSKADLEDSNKFQEPIATEVLEYSTFFPAEEYHQDYYKKSAEHYKRYKKGSGREDFIEENWAKKAALEAAEEDEKNSEKYDYTEEEIEKKLKSLDPGSYHVIVEEGTETPFNNEYWDNKAEGIYVDKVTGKPLFSSTHKYDSGTGWPTFYKTIEEDAVSFEEDNSLLMSRTEVRSESGHLGHVFEDGPDEFGGQRFCMNSASLLFIPKDEMVEKGYEDYLYLFDE